MFRIQSFVEDRRSNRTDEKAIITPSPMIAAHTQYMDGAKEGPAAGVVGRAVMAGMDRVAIELGRLSRKWAMS